MIIKISDLSANTGVLNYYHALKHLLNSGTVKHIELDCKGIGGPVGDKLKIEGYPVSVKESHTLKSAGLIKAAMGISSR